MFLSLLAKRKDFIQIKIKMVAVTNIINFELPAQILANGSDPITKLRKKSNPPNQIKTPITTTICMNNIFFVGTFIARIANNIKRNPNIDGMKEVKEVL